MRPAILHVLSTLEHAGHEAYIVGGYVRDLLLGRETKDCDIATSALPEEVEHLFERVITIGKIHGTIAVVIKDEVIEVTTYRVDGPYDNHRHPQTVTFTPSLKEDLARRDFTINAMAMSRDGSITDLFGGQDDLQVKQIRAVGDPDQRLQEDALRILRAIRFQSVLGMTLEPKLFQAMHAHASLVTQLSKERLLGELRQFLNGAYLPEALATYKKLRLPGLPQSFVANPTLSTVEHFAIAGLLEGYDATNFPWTKDEKTLFGQLLKLPSTPPTDLELYQMSHVDAKLRVGAVVYQWNEESLLARLHALPIQQRKDVTVNGHDVVELGFSGPIVEKIFLAVEEAIVNHQLINMKAEILEWIKEKFHEHQ